MPDNSYNVVFEYDKTMGGLYGVRTWTSYKNQKEYKTFAKYHSGEKAIALDVSQEEALNLTSLTPEICRLMGALEQVFSENSDPLPERVKHTLTNAKYAIVYDRKHIAANGLRRIDARKYINAFKKLIRDTQYTFKGARMSGIMIVCLDDLGQVL